MHAFAIVAIVLQFRHVSHNVTYQNETAGSHRAKFGNILAVFANANARIVPNGQRQAQHFGSYS